MTRFQILLLLTILFGCTQRYYVRMDPHRYPDLAVTEKGDFNHITLYSERLKKKKYMRVVGIDNDFAYMHKKYRRPKRIPTDSISYLGKFKYGFLELNDVEPNDRVRISRGERTYWDRVEAIDEKFIVIRSHTTGKLERHDLSVIDELMIKRSRKPRSKDFIPLWFIVPTVGFFTYSFYFAPCTTFNPCI